MLYIQKTLKEVDITNLSFLELKIYLLQNNKLELGIPSDRYAAMMVSVAKGNTLVVD